MMGREEMEQEVRHETMECKKPGLQVFGIRHLSPAGAWYVRQYLDQIRPKLLLIEGPSDFTELIEELGRDEVKPPVAVMAYTQEVPVRTILYPFSEYSPEYQAILWAKEQGCDCRFCDLPSDVFLGIEKVRKLRQNQELTARTEEEERTKEERAEEETGWIDVYERLDQAAEDGDHETFWERTLEHASDFEGYWQAALKFGSSLRELSMAQERRSPETAENLVRESYMRRVIRESLESGLKPEEIVIVTGAFHADGLLKEGTAMSDKEWKELPRVKSNKTLMPYSYYRLSEHFGYGAGNCAPAYYELLWKGLCLEQPDYAAVRYLTGLAAFQREHGDGVSSAEVIEAMGLASSLANLRDCQIPALKDLRDAAVTCMGHGKLSEIALAVADTEIGTKIGSLPQGVSQTSIQADFYQKLADLKLEKYKSLTAEDVTLDLREKLTVKSQKAAFLDLERSFFLHKLKVLNIRFASLAGSRQENATWAEHWILQWTPEAEIQIVEAVLKGDTVELAAGFELKRRIEESSSIAGIASVVEEACCCGMPEALSMAVSALQETAVEAASITELAETAMSLSAVIRYGDIRRLDRTPLIPLLSQLFLRSCLILSEECSCDDQAAGSVGKAMNLLNEVAVHHEFLDGERWLKVLSDIASRDDLNTRLSGLAASILLERGHMDKEELGREVERRLSRGIPAELGAGWFEGLSMKNHYALIARMTLWQKLSDYLDTLSDEEFKRALIFLRRAFADFSADEKDQIAENLGEIWQVNPSQVSEMVNGSIGNVLEGLDDFDFDDI